MFRRTSSFFLSRLLIAGLVLAMSAILPAPAHSDTLDSLAEQIAQRKADIEKLTAETNALQAELAKTSTVANTLKSAVAELDLSSRKIKTDISLTQSKIASAELDLKQIAIGIDDGETTLVLQQGALGQSLREVSAQENASLIEILLNSPTISAFFDDVNARAQYHSAIEDNMALIASTTKDLQTKQEKVTAKKKELVVLQADLYDKKKGVDATAATKQQLLAQAKGQEAGYQALIASKQAQAAAFAQDLYNFESSLKLAVDPGSFPAARKSVLAWPLDAVKITQAFGLTVDSQRLYRSGTHNGVDFAARVGTPVKSVLQGVVAGVGNTDSYPGCYSYGKWVFIKHPNGLSTIYGHLSIQNVKVGDTVTTGQVIGYSGQTGYATGPHLHLGLFASQGVSVQQYSTSIGCKGVSIPIADPKAYLDPLSYMPAL